MLLSKRSFLLFALALGACGFTPVYGPGGGAQTLPGAIAITAPDDRDSYELVKRLEERLGRQDGARYTLDYQITTREEGVGVTPDQEIKRVQVRGAVTYSVTELATGKVVDKGSVSTFTSYSAEGSTVSTSSTERDAHRRLMVALADLMSTRLIATAPDWLA
ncbi:LPS assembly lipoprotein LptE [Aliiroseovarius subalbicans]|uniref:LPS assembly lipoprotein LptE n=1 Tax=Aliiroseovarius subalbicans TaxID=2925840 RepID=UPI001F5837AF|nr:LPS assembly lipoprotein LptE [Aliiroseovarius subalbicans]MCI2400176.1 hypothetical protein [Aliiroseovarius subalbicans]